MEVTENMIRWYKDLPFEEWVRFMNSHHKNLKLLRRLAMSLVDYSDIQDDIENTSEPKVLPAGSEVKARIISVRTGISDKNDCPWFSPLFDVPEDPMVKEFNDFFWELHRDKLDPKAFERSKFQFKSFASAFGIDYSRPLSLEDDLPGKEGYLIVGVKKDDNYGEQNTVRKYIARR